MALPFETLSPAQRETSRKINSDEIQSISVSTVENKVAKQNALILDQVIKDVEDSISGTV